MRILVVADVMPDPNSGAAGTEYRTVEALRQLGHEVDTRWADAMPRRVAHPNLHLLLELPRRYAHVIDDACAQTAYDVIHCNQPHAYLAARRHRALNREGVFVNRSHGFEAHAASVLKRWHRKLNIPERRFPSNLAGAFIDEEMRRQCRLVVRHVDGLIVSSRADRAFILERYEVASVRVACIAQAAPDVFIHAPVQTMTSERLRNLLFIGPPRIWKGPHVMGPAISSLMERHRDIRLTWVCAPQEQAEAVGFFPDHAGKRVMFVDPLAQEQLSALYDRHGIFLFPSLFEGFGKVFLEAMCRGLCVVASDTGGMADVIQSGKNGLLVPVGDAVAFENAVESLLVDPGLARRLATDARSHAMDYSWKRVAEQTVEFYAALMRMG